MSKSDVITNIFYDQNSKNVKEIRLHISSASNDAFDVDVGSSATLSTISFAIFSRRRFVNSLVLFARHT